MSDRGLVEARAVAQRFKSIPIEALLTSSYIRTLQTAQEIEKITSVPLAQSNLLIERRMPPLFLGKKVDDPEIASIHQEMRDHFFDPDWRYDNEENFADLISRVKKTLELIESQKKENIRSFQTLALQQLI